MQFFIPHPHDDPNAAEAEWQRYLRHSAAPATSKRVYSLAYEHGGSRYTVTIGQRRREYRRQTGPRGGYRKHAGSVSVGAETGTVVSGIVDAGTLFYVWSYGPPFGGWANPALVGRGEVTGIEYFEPSDAASLGDRTASETQ